MTLLSNRIGDYFYISQGKTRIPGVNDSSDMEETDVSPILGDTTFVSPFLPLGTKIWNEKIFSF